MTPKPCRQGIGKEDLDKIGEEKGEDTGGTYAEERYGTVRAEICEIVPQRPEGVGHGKGKKRGGKKQGRARGSSLRQEPKEEGGETKAEKVASRRPEEDADSAAKARKNGKPERSERKIQEEGERSVLPAEQKERGIKGKDLQRDRDGGEDRECDPRRHRHQPRKKRDPRDAAGCQVIFLFWLHAHLRQFLRLIITYRKRIVNLLKKTIYNHREMLYNRRRNIEKHRKGTKRMIKDQVLALLRGSDGFLSGERICEKLGVSRMSVHKAVATLREEGYEITSVTRRGYRLDSGEGRLTLGELLPYLAEGRAKSILLYDTVDSTNTRLKEVAAGGAAEGTVVIAEAQTAGRGRRGRSFYSPRGKGIYLSYLLRPDCTPTDSTSLTAYAAVAVRRAVLRAVGMELGIKWVNDLILGNKKAVGILTELSVESESGQIEYAVIGIGVNVNAEAGDFTGELLPKATALSTDGLPLSRARLAAALIEELDRMSEAFPADTADYLAEYRAANVTVGKHVTVRSPKGEYEALAVGIMDDLSLLVREENGAEHTVFTGEVAVHGLYGE